jgi:hypothetical protein
MAAAIHVLHPNSAPVAGFLRIEAYGSEEPVPFRGGGGAISAVLER